MALARLDVGRKAPPTTKQWSHSPLKRHHRARLFLPPESFAPAVVRAVRNAGYVGACSTLPGYYRSGLPRYVLPRFLVEDPVYFRAVLMGKAFRPGALLQLARRQLARS